MASEELCVRWNDFESNISVAFKELREAKELFNVTLACDENQIKAHKVVLAACSPLFRSILQRNPHDHPLLYLKDVKLSNLKLVLDFMYNGEVKVAEEELISFLAVAGELKLKGFAENNSRPTKQESVFDALPPKPVAPCSPDEQPPSRKPLPTSVLQPKRQSLLLPQNDASKDFVSVKLEPYETPPLEQHQANHPTVQCFNEEDGAENEEKYEDDDQYEGDGFDAQLDRDKDGGFDPSHVTCYEDLLKYVCVKRGRPDEDEGEEEKEGVAAKRTHIDDRAGGEEDLEVFTNQKEEEVVRPYSWFSSIRKRLWGQEEEEEF